MNSIKRTPVGKKNVMTVLKTCLNSAYDSGILNRVPKFPKFTGKNKIVPKPIRWIEVQEQALILEKIPIKDRPIFTFIMLTGCRPSEARALQWKYVKKDKIVFAETFGRFQELKEVKSKVVMNFPMTEALKEFFKDIKRTLSPYVFINPRSKNHYGRDFNSVWNRACKEAGIKINLNNAGRHSFACQMLNSNVPQGLVSRLLRHTNPKQIAVYAEYKTDSLKSAVDSVGQVIDLAKVANKVQTKKKAG